MKTSPTPFLLDQGADFTLTAMAAGLCLLSSFSNWPSMDVQNKILSHFRSTHKVLKDKNQIKISTQRLMAEWLRYPIFVLIIVRNNPKVPHAASVNLGHLFKTPSQGHFFSFSINQGTQHILCGTPHYIFTILLNGCKSVSSESLIHT